MRSKKRLSALEFEALRPLLRISDQRIEAARLAMVEGHTLQSVADRYGWTRQAVGDAVRIVWQQHERYLMAKNMEAAMLQTETNPPSGGRPA